MYKQTSHERTGPATPHIAWLCTRIKFMLQMHKDEVFACIFIRKDQYFSKTDTLHHCKGNNLDMSANQLQIKYVT